MRIDGEGIIKLFNQQALDKEINQHIVEILTYADIFFNYSSTPEFL